LTGAIVLAGGRARRFGADKLAARLPDDRSVLDHATSAVAEIADEIVVVIAPGVERPEGLPVHARIVHDFEYDAGPLLGLAAGLDAIDARQVLVVGGDMPALDGDVLRLLVAALEAHPDMEAACLAVEGSARPSVLPSALRRVAAQRACREAIAAGDRRLRGCLERMATTLVPVEEWQALDPTGRTLLDIDRPDDLVRFERHEPAG
jgi:molybdenum cofactor guanylyltransferase